MENGHHGNDPHVQLFNKIALIYKIAFPYQIIRYRHIIKKNMHLFGLPAGATVLDIGCGTGAFTFALREYGFRVTGVDAAKNMVELGIKEDLDCKQGDVRVGLPFEDNRFDMVVSAFVAHGLTKPHRKQLFFETKRLAKHKVIFHDYNKTRGPLTDAVEWLEGGDYFNFIYLVEEELRELFRSVRMTNVARQAAWYICIP